MKTIWIFLALPLLQWSCKNEPLSVEETIRKFVELQSSGDCAAAQELCIENAYETMQASIDTGCEPRPSEVLSCECETRENVTRCRCIEKIDGMDLSIPYALKQVDGEWKIFDLTKDCGPEVWDED